MQKRKYQPTTKNPRKRNEFKLPPHTYENVISTLSQKQCWSIKKTNIPNTWKVTEGEDIKVMVIDTGWTDHHDIGDNAIKGIHTIGKDIIDREGHQTHCVGIICAQNNDYGMVGVAPKAKVICVKALDDSGSGSNKSICDALDYAIEVKPDVISMSLGSPSPSLEIHKRIKKLYQMNIAIICAAGNDGSRGVDYPGAHPETIAVGAYDEDGNIANFSGVGDEVDFVAPGVNIYSTYLNNQYVNMNGTSMATPYMAGVVALLLSKHKKQEKETGENDCKTVEQLKQHLLKYTIDKGYVGKDKQYGYGLVDVENMILAKNDPSLDLPMYKAPWTERLTNWFRNIFVGFFG
jgi:subtilisin family serine protease